MQHIICFSWYDKLAIHCVHLIPKERNFIVRQSILPILVPLVVYLVWTIPYGSSEKYFKNTLANIIGIIGIGILCRFWIFYFYCCRSSVTLVKLLPKFEILIRRLAPWRHTRKMRKTSACNPGVCSCSAGLID